MLHFALHCTALCTSTHTTHPALFPLPPKTVRPGPMSVALHSLPSLLSPHTSFSCLPPLSSTSLPHLHFGNHPRGVIVETVRGRTVEGGGEGTGQGAGSPLLPGTTTACPLLPLPPLGRQAGRQACLCPTPMCILVFHKACCTHFPFPFSSTTYLFALLLVLMVGTKANG